MTPVRVAVLCGGPSPEHWISLKSALFVMLHLDRSRYEVEAVYLDPRGREVPSDRWPGVVAEFLRRNKLVLHEERDGLPDPEALLASCARRGGEDFVAAGARGRWDVWFPVFHGSPGEDGTVQALARSLGIPCAGCSLEGSAMGMDKIHTKQLVAAAGIPVAPWVVWESDSGRRDDGTFTREVEAVCGYPVFVKPARLGSSIGVGRARDATEFRLALDHARSWDTRILVEAEVTGPECAVGLLEGPQGVETSEIAEYTSHPGNFGYESKYGPRALQDIIPASFSPEDTRKMKEHALRVWNVLGMGGMCRVDSFLSPGGPVLNEVNTMPGMNPASPFMRGWEAAGVSKKQVLSRLVDQALLRKRS